MLHMQGTPYKIILTVMLFCTLSVHSMRPIDMTFGQWYQGTYQAPNTSKTFEYLENHKGRIKAFFSGSHNLKEVNTLSLYFMDPTYEDERVVLLELKGILSVSGTNNWINENHRASYTVLWKNREAQTIYVENVNSKIMFFNLNTGNYHDVNFQIQMKGPNFQFSAYLTYDNEIMSTLAYCLYVTGVVLIQIFSAHKIMSEGDWDTNPHLIKMSLLTLCLCNIQDFAATMINIDQIVARKSGFLLFIFPALAYLILFALFDMKMLFLAWKGQYNTVCQTQQLLRQNLTAFYSQFYLGLFIYLTLNYFFVFDSWMIVLKNMILLPQIIHNVKIGHKPGFSEAYVFGFIGVRLLIPIYERACSFNRFNLAPNYTLVILLVSIYAVEALVLFLQHKLGSRFFIPKQFIPNYFEYRRTIRQDESNKDRQCSICIQNIFAPNLKSIVGQPIDDELLYETEIMMTPCKHYFHQECLNEWMNVKPQCPTCRSQLPIF